MAAIARGPRQSTTTASSKFKAQTLKPKVSKLAEGLEMLSFANGDEFTGSKQQDAGINNHDFIHAQFMPTGPGTYKAQSRCLHQTCDTCVSSSQAMSLGLLLLLLRELCTLSRRLLSDFVFSCLCSGYTYAGSFVQGLLVGDGTVTNARGDVTTGTFFPDATSQGTVVYQNGDRYTGSLVHNKRHGFY